MRVPHDELRPDLEGSGRLGGKSRAFADGISKRTPGAFAVTILNESDARPTDG